MGKEIELKLVLGPKRLAKLVRDPVLADAAIVEPRTERLVSVYYDTEDRALAAHGAAFRVRRVGDRWIQTVKRGGEHDYERGEWEAEVADGTPVPDAVADDEIRRLLAAHGDRIEEVFTTDFERIVHLLRLPSGTEVEVAVDRGEIRSGDGTAPIHEVELELKEGEIADLFKLARRLHRRAGFRLETRSKAARGYALGTPDQPSPVKANAPALAAGLPVEQAFKRIARACITHMRGNERCVLLDADPGGVHQMRVAARRLRSVFTLFRKVLPTRRARRVRRGLRWIAKELADARAWDVFANETLAPLQARLPDDSPLKDLAEEIERARRRAYERARHAVESGKYTRLLLDVGRWLESPWQAKGDDTADERLALPIGELAPRILEKRYRKAAAARDVGDLPRADLHSLRIECKKLRYAAHFLGSLYPGRDADGFADELGTLQDILGRIQDVADTPVFLGRLPHARDPAFARPIGIVAGWQAAAEHAARAALPHHWDHFLARPRFWSD